TVKTAHSLRLTVRRFLTTCWKRRYSVTKKVHSLVLFKRVRVSSSKRKAAQSYLMKSARWT
ncbi:AAA domain family protein, partial [Vibrio parahaemolyticus V-223/04]